MADDTTRHWGLAAACEQFRGSTAPPGYRDGLALCVIDSVQSTGVKYASVENVVARYREYRRAQGDDPNRDGVCELVATFDELGGPEGWAAQIGNRNRTSPRNGVLKSEAILSAARVLVDCDIHGTVDLRRTADREADLEQLRARWCEVKGQGSGITWHYMQMLAGIPGVKPDRMIRRFIAEALEMRLAQVTPGFALESLTAAATLLGMSPTDLDHAVWRYQRTRR